MPSLEWPAETADTPLHDLVEGMGEIATQRIPYARLPRRLSAHSGEFVRWSDLASETPRSLLARPRVGQAAVEAVVEAAVDAVAVRRAISDEHRAGAVGAVEQLLGRLSDYDCAVLSARVWARCPDQRASADVAKRLGVSEMSVRRNQGRAVARFRELLTEPAHREVCDVAAGLGQRLGPYVPINLVEAELGTIGVDPRSQVADVLLHVAGPYTVSGEWAENAAAGGCRSVRAAVDDLFVRCPAPKAEAVRAALRGVGMPEAAAERFERTHLVLRRFGDVFVRWDGRTTADLVEAVLHGLGAASSVEDIHAGLGEGVASVERVADLLSEDERFVRASRRTWSLSSWGGARYTSIVDAIGECVIAHGGRVRVDQVVSEVLDRFPDVAESSVRAYLQSLVFVQDSGFVRKRKKSDAFPDVGPLDVVRGTFCNGPDEVRLALKVTGELLRGSALPMHPAVANAVGVSPGKRKSFTAGQQQSEISVAWKLSSVRRATLSSLRAHARSVGAELGDLLVLAFRLDEDRDSVEVTRVGADLTGIGRLELVLGRRVVSVEEVADSLECASSEVESVLRRRGDHALADDVVSLQSGQ
ncbi:hypothetical protein AB4Z39_04840 [Mycobacterium adipatum]|uniref:hypothetical protein n=1 Tax=Mycobacterium adipatum TaxID=1682113 RepID=UPI0034E0658B